MSHVSSVWLSPPLFLDKYLSRCRLHLNRKMRTPWPADGHSVRTVVWHGSTRGIQNSSTTANERELAAFVRVQSFFRGMFCLRQH